MLAISPGSWVTIAFSAYAPARPPETHLSAQSGDGRVRPLSSPHWRTGGEFLRRSSPPERRRALLGRRERNSREAGCAASRAPLYAAPFHMRGLGRAGRHPVKSAGWARSSDPDPAEAKPERTYEHGSA